jgi:phage/plasmid-associated DNA primase
MDYIFTSIRAWYDRFINGKYDPSKIEHSEVNEILNKYDPKGFQSMMIMEDFERLVESKEQDKPKTQITQIIAFEC